MTDISPSDRLERSMLYVPASRPNMIEKAAASDADAVCIDLEDAVIVDEKPASRANVVRAFRELDFGRKLKARELRHIGYVDALGVHRFADRKPSEFRRRQRESRILGGSAHPLDAHRTGTRYQRPSCPTDSTLKTRRVYPGPR